MLDNYYKGLMDCNNREELLKIWNNNKGLEDFTLELYIDNEMFWINENLEYISRYLFDYAIGFHNYNFIDIADKQGFIKGVKELQKDMEILPIDKAKEILESNNITLIEHFLIEQFDKITRIPTTDELRIFFLDMFIDIVNAEQYYIDKEYHLYKAQINNFDKHYNSNISWTSERSK